MNANGWLWSHITALGWWWWGVWVLVAAYNVYLLTRMGHATTKAGRWARVTAWVGHFCMLFSPGLNSLGLIALPLLLVSNSLHYKQLADACAKAPESANPPYRARRIMSSLITDK